MWPCSLPLPHVCLGLGLAGGCQVGQPLWWALSCCCPEGCTGRGHWLAQSPQAGLPPECRTFSSYSGMWSPGSTWAAGVSARSPGDTEDGGWPRESVSPCWCGERGEAGGEAWIWPSGPRGGQVLPHSHPVTIRDRGRHVFHLSISCHPALGWVLCLSWPPAWPPVWAELISMQAVARPQLAWWAP